MRIPTHYYADVELRIMRTQDAYLQPYTRVTHSRAADENISRFETIIGFPLNRILFHSSSAYRTIETCPITYTFLRPHIETYRRQYVAAAEKEYYTHRT